MVDLSFVKVKKAKENVLYPKNITYGDSRVEVSLSDMISHSTARILEFLYEENSELVKNMTSTEKLNLELWGKVGGDGQGDHMEYRQKNVTPESGASVYCVSFVPLLLKAKG